MVKQLRSDTGAGMMDCKKALTESQGDMEEAKDILRKRGQAIAIKKSSRETKEGAISISSIDNKTALVKIACETDFVAKNSQFQEFINGIAQQAIEVGADNLMEKETAKGPLKEQFVEAIQKMGENIVFIEGEAWEAEAGSVIGTYTHTNSKIGVMVELSSDADIDKDKQMVVTRDIAMHIAASSVEAVSENDLDPEVVEKEKRFLIDQAKESGKPEAIIEKMVEGRLKKFKKEICLLYQNFVKNPDKTVERHLADEGKELGAKLIVKRFYKNQF
jgi:elongation factor Ts